jgi:hypothetical protein
MKKKQFIIVIVVALILQLIYAVVSDAVNIGFNDAQKHKQE